LNWYMISQRFLASSNFCGNERFIRIMVNKWKMKGCLVELIEARLDLLHDIESYGMFFSCHCIQPWIDV
jgi:hypothetical protein